MADKTLQDYVDEIEELKSRVEELEGDLKEASNDRDTYMSALEDIQAITKSYV